MKKNSNTEERDVVFIQYDMPPLKSGEYTAVLKQQVNQQAAPFSTTRKFAVSGERFSFDPQDINSCFPQNLANGEFSGVLPHVVFNRRSLPWERYAVADEEDAPWLAVILLNADEVQPVTTTAVKDLVPEGEIITVRGSSVTGKGMMPPGYFSYPGMNYLDYGETPDEACTVIDLPAAIFNSIIPSKQDLPFLAHIRKMETLDKADSQVKDEEYYAVVTGNRIPQNGKTSYVFLVSLENFGPYLPDAAGASNLPPNTQYVRLCCYLTWSYTVNDDDQTFKGLLEHLNKDAAGKLGLTTLQVPFGGNPPAPEQVRAALLKQSTGSLGPADATVLVNNALVMGYTPHNHHLRHSGHTVSWYRSTLLPYAVKEKFELPITCPDAANRYNPETGLFDVSYGAAWQLGQLLALQNKAFATALYNWKKSLYAWEVIVAEQKIIDEKYKGITAFSTLFRKRKQRLNAAKDPPEDVVKWMGKLSLLNGVPFNYLVPDERMLPTESLRFFLIDNNWIDALMDGAFSIGRSAAASLAAETPSFHRVLSAAKTTARQFRRRKVYLRDYVNASQTVSGFLLRSAVLKGWPGLEINGYSDKDGNNELPKLRMESLSEEVMICIFDGVVEMVSIHEPPESLHSGVDGIAPDFTVGLRVVQGSGNPGEEIKGAKADIPVRSDHQTIVADKAAANMKEVLNAPPLNEGIIHFTSAEFALEMIKGVVKVDFVNDK